MISGVCRSASLSQSILRKSRRRPCALVCVSDRYFRPLTVECENPSTRIRTDERRWFGHASRRTDEETESRARDASICINTNNSHTLPPPIVISKPWLDVSAPLSLRVQSLLAAPIPLHPADANSNEVFHLIKQCCRASQDAKSSVSPLQALTWAQDILERLILEKKKHHMNQTQQQSTSRPDDTSIHIPPHDLTINIKLWDLLVFAWARQMSSQAAASSSSSSNTGSNKPQAATAQRIAPARMQQVMERALEEAIWDQENIMAAATTKNNNHTGNAHRNSSLPTVDILNTFLYGLAQSASFSGNAHSQAQAILTQMQELHTLRGWHCRPNTKSYSHALAACAKAAQYHHVQHHNKSGTEASPAFMALDLLRQMQAAHATEKAAYEEQYQQRYQTRHPDRNRRRVVTADSVAYTTTMQAMANAILYSSSNQPRRGVYKRQQQQLIQHVLALLQEMMDCRDGTVVADSAAFVVALQALARLAGSRQQPQELRTQAAQTCEEVLQKRLAHMETVTQMRYNDDEEENDGNDDEASHHLLKDLTDPQKIRMAFNICLDAWSRSGAPEAVDECERILQSMLAPDSQSAMPDSSSLHACLRACSLSSHPRAVDRACELLNLQHELVSSGLLTADARPDFQSYCLMILSVANCKSLNRLEKVRRARDLLEEMARGAKSGIVRPLRNPAAPFSAVLTAATQSFAAPHASEDVTASVSGDMEFDEAYFKGEESSAADSTVSDAIYEIAQQTYADAKQDSFRLGVTPDHHLFAAMLRVLTAAFPKHDEASAIPTIRASAAEAIMADAQESGQVSRLVVFAWTNALSLRENDALSKLLPDQRRQLPKLWARNVPPEFRYRIFSKGSARTKNQTSRR